MARAIAIDAVRGQEAEISSATFVVRAGTVAESQANVGPACTSGRLIEVKLIGTFPHIATTGHPVSPGEHADFTVTAMNVTGDATSGRVCRTGVQTGVVKPEPGATVIALDRAHTSAASRHPRLPVGGGAEPESVVPSRSDGT